MASSAPPREILDWINLISAEFVSFTLVIQDPNKNISSEYTVSKKPSLPPAPAPAQPRTKFVSHIRKRRAKGTRPERDGISQIKSDNLCLSSENNTTCGYPGCKKVLSDGDHLKRHFSGIHLGKHFVCKICSMEFLRNDKYNKHIPFYHPGLDNIPLGSISFKNTKLLQYILGGGLAVDYIP